MDQIILGGSVLSLCAVYMILQVQITGRLTRLYGVGMLILFTILLLCSVLLEVYKPFGGSLDV